MTRTDDPTLELKIAGFQIVDSEAIRDPVPSERHPWKRRGIYLSRVCLAVHVSPVTVRWNTMEQDAAKETLFRYLKRVHHTALEHGVICPLACVVSFEGATSELPVARQVAAWGTDQDWHRGGFTLYTDQSTKDWNHWHRLADLLQPKAEVLVASVKAEPRDGRWFARKLRETTESNPAVVGLERSLTHELVEAFTNLFSIDEAQPQGREEVKKRANIDTGDLAEWRRRTIAKAREDAVTEAS